MLDVAGGDWVQGLLFEFANEKPFSDHFEEYEFPDMNFFPNSGSMIFPIFILMLVI
jgi:hypothetical protein